jgi:outer membrane protein insertion porin family
MSRRALRIIAMLAGACWLVPRSSFADDANVESSETGVSGQSTDAAEEPKAPVLSTWGTDKSPPAVPQETKTKAAEAQSTPAAEEDTKVDVPAGSELDEEATSRPLDSFPREAESDQGAHHLRYTIERIEIHGNFRTRSRVILRYLKYKPGDILDVDDPELTLTRYRVLGTGFFRDVQFTLHKGSRRGKVVLIVDVVERNTIVVSDVGMGISSDAGNTGNTRPLTAYGGVDVAETNLGGTGWTLGIGLAVANEQSALRVRFLDPAFLGTPWMLSGTLLRNQARDFFGTTAHVDWTDWANIRHPDASYAVIDYSRFGGTFGVGRDLSTSTQLWLYYRLETIESLRPRSASEDRGNGTEPIQFDIRDGRSVLSTVRATLQLDTRDHPFLPTSGWYVSTWGELSLAPFGSDYDYQRFDVSASKWWRVNSSNHALKLQLFAGAENGAVPFFEQYYIGDFTDFRSPRMLGLNFERRPPPAIFGGIIKEQRYGQYAAKVGLEYRIPVYRGSRSVFGIDLFLSTGLWSLIRREDLYRMPRDYTGTAQVPLDLTANVGFRMDTAAGGLTFAFSNILGFIPFRENGQ